MAGFHDGVSKIWTVRISSGGLDIDGHRTHVEAASEALRSEAKGDPKLLIKLLQELTLDLNYCAKSWQAVDDHEYEFGHDDEGE